MLEIKLSMLPKLTVFDVSLIDRVYCVMIDDNKKISPTVNKNISVNRFA